MNYGYNCYDASSISCSWRFYKSSGLTANSGKLTAVTNGYGSATRITYDVLTNTNADVYTKGSGGQYPTIDVKPPLAVVKSVVADNGAAGNTSASYKYAGAKMHLQGKGFLGFASRTVSNTTLGVVAESGVKAWNATYHAPSEIYEKTTVDGKTAETAVKYTFVDKAKKKYFAHPSTKIEKDLDGNIHTTTYAFDANGNLTEEKTRYGSSSMYSTTQYGTYVTTGGGTAPSKPRLITSIQKHADDKDAFTRKTYLTYNTTKGYPTQKIENYGTPLALTTGYTYDSFGNLTAYTVSGSAYQPLPTTEITTPQSGSLQRSTPARPLRCTPTPTIPGATRPQKRTKPTRPTSSPPRTPTTAGGSAPPPPTPTDEKPPTPQAGETAAPPSDTLP